MPNASEPTSRSLRVLDAGVPNAVGALWCGAFLAIGGALAILGLPELARHLGGMPAIYTTTAETPFDLLRALVVSVIGCSGVVYGIGGSVHLLE